MLTQRVPFRYFKANPKIIRLAVMFDVRCPVSLRKVEALVHERGIETSRETVRFWWNRYGRMFPQETKCDRLPRY